MIKANEQLQGDIRDWLGTQFIMLTPKQMDNLLSQCNVFLDNLTLAVNSYEPAPRVRDKTTSKEGYISGGPGSSYDSTTKRQKSVVLFRADDGELRFVTDLSEIEST